MFYAIARNTLVAQGASRNEVMDTLPPWIEDGEELIIAQRVAILSAQTQRVWEEVK